ncbi:hypothetical protein ONA91_04440 [Micromonospora sp. DR5-3]|uniref:hypothetical protein n=1 Tax=unclassified Micromonospora TaxID=2617518 RepID=UPI0011D7EFA7|nr:MULTISPECIES: hypothetical protein [unclassified Micromonospora]MCW3813707.1 hypothetical protein [Micromonospora sp. DR5-3]TYC25599.1 hypothetical protein FXF52_04040 [Micromonospora sp. MP36]
MTPNPTRLYLAAAAHSAAELAAATAALLAAGFLVTSATVADTIDPDDLVSVVADDLNAVASADALVTVGDCAALFEPVTAELYGVPIATLAEALAVTR